MKGKKGKKRWLKRVLIVLLAVAVLFVAAFFILSSRTSTTTSLNTATAYIGSIQVGTEGSGTIEAAEETLVLAEYTLKIDSVEAEDGDTVEEGDVIATINQDSIQEQIDLLVEELSTVDDSISSASTSGSSSLTSPIAGRVKRIYAKSGDVLSDVVEEYGGVMELSVGGKLKVEVGTEETLKIGETVTVAFLSYEVDGTVQSEEDGVYTILIDDGANYLVDAEATVTDADDVLIGTGVLQSNHPYLVEAAYGIADEISVDIGDSVSSGSTLLTRTDYTYNGDYLDLLTEREEIIEELTALRELYRNPVLTASGEGIVSNLTLAAGMTVAENETMYSLISTDQFSLKVEIDELDIDGIEVGQTATIIFDAFETEEYTGTVEKISALGENTNGVASYTVTIAVPGAEKLKTAMSATATIIIDEADDALLVPVDAVSTADGQDYVTVVNNGVEETKEVAVGLINNTLAQITEGLSEGDTVVVSTETESTSWIDSLMMGGGGGDGGDMGGGPDRE
ncbi:MAG: efflux RND transporter periplasmic adaptor subunit [Lachnospiraceae bacterium]|nr:efflux RND transporter periplasmic adaptor subunit [Lachnospiraceae bacterium]